MKRNEKAMRRQAVETAVGESEGDATRSGRNRCTKSDRNLWKGKLRNMERETAKTKRENDATTSGRHRNAAKWWQLLYSNKTKRWKPLLPLSAQAVETAMQRSGAHCNGIYLQWCCQCDCRNTVCDGNRSAKPPTSNFQR